MRGLRELRHWSLIPVLVWIAVQFAMTGALPVEPGSRGGEAFAPYGSGAMVICTPAGPVEMDAAAFGVADAVPEPEPGSTVDRGECTWCKAFSLADLPAPAGAAIRVRHATGRDGVPIADAGPAGLHCAADGFRSRAPPLSSDC